MEPRLYNRLLFRLLGMPVAALIVLALILASSLQRVESSANAVDHSDRVIAHANRLIKLMVDEETGLRGFLLTRDPIFLKPFHDADQRLEPEFEELASLVQSRPAQVALLKQIQATHVGWEEQARTEISLATKQTNFLPNMLERKQKMDALRAQLDEFISAEESYRTSRSAIASRISRVAMLSLIALAALAAVLIAWLTQRLFHQVAATYNRQIAEVKWRGEEVYAREQWLNTTLRSIGDAVIACDADGNIVFMNPVAEQLTGWREAEAHNVPLHEVFRIFNEETRATVENPVDKVRRLGKVVGLANHTFLIAKDGTEISIDDSGAPIRNSHGKIVGIVLVFRDITERRLSENALMRAEKLAAAGRMAASMAHEVNNPLEGLTNLVYIAERSDDLEEVRELLKKAGAELGRIAHITRQSLGFYREASMPALYQPGLVAREVTDFFNSRARAQGVKLVVNAETDMKVMGKAGELRQILSNLLANSLDACQTGAVVCVRARQALDPKNSSRQGVRITVADTGTGIARKHIDHIFEPFYTTKKDTGTGLGLWVCKELIEKHGGSLQVRSATSGVRTGTVFSLFLPEVGSTRIATLVDQG